MHVENSKVIKIKLKVFFEPLVEREQNSTAFNN